MKVVVFGQGYVGLPLALAAASAGYDVIGFDINESLVKNLNLGSSHIEDISSPFLQSLISNGKYRASSTPEDFAFCEIAVIAVPTPLGVDREPNLNPLVGAAQTLGKNLKVKSLANGI